MKSPLYSGFRNAIFNEYNLTFILTKIAIKIVVKIHPVVNGDNLDWPTYAITLRARQIENQNTRTSVTIAEANSSICGPIYVILFVFTLVFKLFLMKPSGNSYFPAAKLLDFVRQNH